MKILSMIVNLYFMSLLNRLSCVPCMPAWSTCPRPNVPKACQRRANFSTCRANVSNGVPIFQPRLPKGVPIFQPFFKRIFQFLSFQIMLNTCKFQEYLGKSRKFTSRKSLNFYICKISLRKNLINLNPLASFSMEPVRLTQQLFG